MQVWPKSSLLFSNTTGSSEELDSESDFISPDSILWSSSSNVLLEFSTNEDDDVFCDQRV